MDFLQQMQQEQQRLSQSNNQDNKPRIDSLAKHEFLEFRDQDSYLVRILPPVEPSKPFAVGFREAFLEATNANGKTIGKPFRLPLQRSDNSTLDQAFTKWVQEKRVPNRFSGMGRDGEYKFQNPAKRFYVNAVLLQQDNQGNIVEARDENGNIKVQILKLPQTAYEKIIKLLSEEMNIPQGAQNYSFISENTAFPLKIEKPVRGSQGAMAYDVNLYQNRPLGQLQDNWREFAEDLEFFAQSDEEYNPDFVNYFIAVVDGKEEEYNNSRANGDADGGSGEQPQQSFSQPNFAQPQQNNQPNNQPNFNQGQGQQQSQQQLNDNWTPQTPQQAPQQQQQFGGQNNGQNGGQPQWNPGQQNNQGQQQPQPQQSQVDFDQDLDDLPMSYDQPNNQNNQQSQPQQQNQQQQQAPQQNQQQPNQNQGQGQSDGEPGSVDDLLASIDSNFNM